MHRLLALVAAGLALATVACSAPASSTSTPGDVPLPTIGLGSDIGTGGEITGGADVRVVGSTEIDTVVMVGDSITVASTPALETMFARLGFDNVLIQAQQSKRMADGGQSNPSGAIVAANVVNLIESADPGGADEDPSDHSNELWVVALGTNDIGQFSDPAERAAAINEVLDSVPDESMLVWVDTYWRERADASAELNESIADRVLRRGNSAIARWNDVADDEGNLRSDGVHPREQGSIVFADVVGNTIVDFLELA